MLEHYGGFWRMSLKGDPCPKSLRHQFKVPYGRGLCVVKGDEKHGFACFEPWLDLCR